MRSKTRQNHLFRMWIWCGKMHMETKTRWQLKLHTSPMFDALPTPWRTSNTQDSPWPGLRRSHHRPPYSILCDSPRGPHLNDFLSQDSQVGVLKFSQLGLSRLWGHITSRVDFRLQWGLKQNYSPGWVLFNGVSNVAYTQGNRVDFWLLVVGNQVVNLTLDLFFGHNLCFRCPNGQCESISNIYVSIDF